MRHHAIAIDAAAATSMRHIPFTSIVDTDEGSPFCFSPVSRDAERRLAVCGVPSTILRYGLYSDFILEHWLMPSQTSGELVLPTGHGRVAPISRNDVAAAVAPVAVGSDKSRSAYVITGRRALDFDQIAAAYGEAIKTQVRYRPCSHAKYLTLESARLKDRGLMPSAPCAPRSPKIAIVRSPSTSLPSPDRNQRASETFFFEQRPGVGRLHNRLDGRQRLRS